MLRAAGVQEYRDFGLEMRSATLVIDAVLGTGLNGAANGPALDAILEINSSFPFAKVVAVDIPSGLSGASGTPPGGTSGNYVRADATVTFTAPKVCHAMPPACNLMGDLVVAPIGSPASHYENDNRIQLGLITPESIAPLFAPRPRDSNKGKFGHVLFVAGSRNKPGAAAMSGLSALRAGAGLVTVACPASAMSAVASHSAELMTEPLPETAAGEIARSAFEHILELAGKRTLVAIGPGIGTDDETRATVMRLFYEVPQPMVIDADALNCLAAGEWSGNPGSVRVLTPHPGEMSRLTDISIADIQSDRIAAARSLATTRNVIVVLKGERTLIAFPDGRVWINPTGSPSMATGGTGDILTGMVSGMMGQFPGDPDRAIAAAVYLHGLAGELAARHLTEQTVIATDLLNHLAEGIRAITNIPHAL
jgi:NAD(P)H-hydrate epimerase